MQQKLNIISNCIIPHNIVLLGSLKERSMKNNDWKVNPEKPDVPLNKNDAFQKVQKRRVQEKR